jgi:hypothetical protein
MRTPTWHIKLPETERLRDKTALSDRSGGRFCFLRGFSSASPCYSLRMRLLWLAAALVLAALLALFEREALEYFIYWRYPWSDTFMHLLGGAAIGALAAGLLTHQFRPWRYLGLIALACIGWEVFEYLIGASSPKGFVLDTSSDLLFDAIGAAIVYAIARFSLWRSA